jgi:hypothetical protein
VVGLLGLLASPFVGPRGQPIVLEDIASLLKSGAITDEEFEAEKRRILDRLEVAPRPADLKFTCIPPSA